jgi:excisionase family DNA binding protein
VSGRETLLRSLSADLVEAIEELVDERVAAALEPATDGSGSPWLDVDQAAEYLRVSTRTVERRVAGGRVRSTTIGRRRLFHRDDLDELAGAATREDVTPATPPRRRARTLDRVGEEE